MCLALHKQWSAIWQELPSTAEAYIGKMREFCSFLVSVGDQPACVLMFGGAIAPGSSQYELRGFAIRPDAPRNLGSKAISLASRELKRLGVGRFDTLSVPGRFDMAVYKASAFKEVDQLQTESGLPLVRLRRDT